MIRERGERETQTQGSSVAGSAASVVTVTPAQTLAAAMIPALTPDGGRTAGGVTPAQTAAGSDAVDEVTPWKCWRFYCSRWES